MFQINTPFGGGGVYLRGAFILKILKKGGGGVGHLIEVILLLNAFLEEEFYKFCKRNEDYVMILYIFY